MKTPPTTAVTSPAAQLEAAEVQARDLRQRRAELQADLEALRDQQQNEMRRAFGSGGTSPDLRTIRAKVAEAAVLVDQADVVIADSDRHIKALCAEIAASRTEEEKAAHAAELARRSAIAEARLAELQAILEAADKAAGAVVLAIAELEPLDKGVCNRFVAEARHLDGKAALLARGWKIGEFLYTGEFQWEVDPLLPPLRGLGSYPGVNLRGYLAARAAAAEAAPGA